EAALLAALASAEVASAGESSTAGGVLRHLGGGAAQAGADFVDVQLHDAALLAFLGFEGPGLQSPLNDDPSTTLQGFSDVLSHFTPQRAAPEPGLRVLELGRLAVEATRRRGHGEVCDSRTVGCEAQLANA